MITQRGVYLNIVLIAPLCGEGSLGPGVVHRQQGDVVPHISSVKVLMGIVSKDSLVLRAVENATASTHHGCYGHNLLRTLHDTGVCCQHNLPGIGAG